MTKKRMADFEKPELMLNVKALMPALTIIPYLSASVRSPGTSMHRE